MTLTDGITSVDYDQGWGDAKAEDSERIASLEAALRGVVAEWTVGYYGESVCGYCKSLVGECDVPCVVGEARRALTPKEAEPSTDAPA